jgi:hypothetical protein
MLNFIFKSQKEHVFTLNFTIKKRKYEDVIPFYISPWATLAFWGKVFSLIGLQEHATHATLAHNCLPKPSVG